MVVDRRSKEESRCVFDITYGLLVTVLGILLTLEYRVRKQEVRDVTVLTMCQALLHISTHLIPPDNSVR